MRCLALECGLSLLFAEVAQWLPECHLSLMRGIMFIVINLEALMNTLCF